MSTLYIPSLSNQEQDFPDLDTAHIEPNGLLAMGGDLSPNRLIHAYQRGIFPWFDEHQPILWWSPNPRCVIWPQDLKISRSLKKSTRNRGYECTQDKAFREVMEACSGPRVNSSGTWITEDMKCAYQELHTIGVAHSVEIWLKDNLVGGLYGLCLGPFFFGESMFSRATDASKIALIYLVHNLTPQGLTLVDCQVENPHLMSLGATLMARQKFSQILQKRVTANPKESVWHPNWSPPFK